MKCEFCTLVENENRAVFENDLAWSFVTHTPIVVGHTLIVPKRCVDKISDLTEEEIRDMFDLIAKLRTPLRKVFGAEGFNYAWNEGQVAGQEVPHIHIHMLPRKEGDTGVMQYEPREFLYRPGDREKAPQDELIVIAKEIREALD